jgi:hypothetical protein
MDVGIRPEVEESASDEKTQFVANGDAVSNLYAWFNV